MTFPHDFLAVQGSSGCHDTRARTCDRQLWVPLYVRGLLGPDGPKSVQPIAARLGLPGHDQPHHFVSSLAWDDGPLWRVLTEQADRLLGGEVMQVAGSVIWCQHRRVLRAVALDELFCALSSASWS